MAISKINFDNIVQTTNNLLQVMCLDKDNRPCFRTYAIPQSLIVKLERYLDNLDDEDLEYDDDGAVTRVHDDDALNELLMTMFNVELEERRFIVTVSFNVDAHTAKQASDIVENAIEWSNYDIESVDD